MDSTAVDLLKGTPVAQVTIEELVDQLKNNPGHPVRARIGDLTIEVRAVDEQAPARPAADVFAELGPWAGESTEEILRVLADARRSGGRRSVPAL
jgi:hypothetical protein